jgi:methyl-accepting chemotaxis protein
MFASLSLGKKLAIGFGAILLLVAVVGAISYSALSKSSVGFDDYRAIARDANLAGRIQANNLALRMHAKDYIHNSNAAALQRYEESRERVDTLIQKAQKEVDAPDRVALINQIAADRNIYDSTFSQIIALMAQRDNSVKNVMDIVGPEAEKNLTKILTSAKEDENVGAVYIASQAIRNLLLARLYADKFLDTNDHAAVNRAEKEFAQMEEVLHDLSRELNNPQSKQLLAEVTRHVQTYQRAFTQAVEAIERRNLHVRNGLDVLGPGFADKIELIRVSIQNDQDTLGPQLQASNHRSVQIILTLVALALIGGVAATLVIVRNITQPIILGVNFAREIAQGDFSHRINMNRLDEIGLLTRELDNMADSLAQNAEAAKQIAQGNLNVDVRLASDRDELGLALQQMVDGLNSSLGQVQIASEQINVAASEISDSSQSLSQGATESASSLEEISSSLNELASQTKINAENSAQADRLALAATESAQNGNDQMHSMVTAMEEINAASLSISRIIKTIDEIAFQTNLLALNAAVEDARAGQHGKGFAVVAEEVRSLAARSAKAAEETSHLIEGSIAKTNNGSQIAAQTAKALQEIVADVSKVKDLVEDISIASKEQSEGVNQINIGVSQIDEVTQQNTASAEQSAAASEELSSQALQMQEMLRQFKLKNRLRTPQRQQAPQKRQAALPQGNFGDWGSPSELKKKAARPQIALDDNEFGRF